MLRFAISAEIETDPYARVSAITVFHESRKEPLSLEDSEAVKSADLLLQICALDLCLPLDSRFNLN